LLDPCSQRSNITAIAKEKKGGICAGFLKLENMIGRIVGRPADQTKIVLMWAGAPITPSLSS